MRTKLLHTSEHGQRTFAVVLDAGDEVMGCLKRAAAYEKLTGASLSAIGAFSGATLAYFDWSEKAYKHIPVEEQVEVATMLGDIGVDEEGKPALHVHLVLGKRDGSAVAGHLLKATVRPTLEVIVVESPGHLRRRKDPTTGLHLIQLEG